MRYAVVLLLGLFAGFVLESCIATQGDIAALSSSVDATFDRIAERLAAGEVDATEVFREELGALSAQFQSVAEEIGKRGEGFLSEGAEQGGLIGIGSALLLNLYRNRTRRKELELVEERAKH